jgi:two-component system, OmpR family, alkaline phosphatase synthesis response regulator PhoP
MNKKNRVLVVDDETDILEMLDYNLSKEGYEVIKASDGLAAIEAAKEHLPHLILLDVMMPKIDGIETCRRLREITKLKDTYIIFLTARAEEFTEIAAFEAGANDYLAKPIKPRALLSRLAAYFRRDQSVTADPGTVTVGDLVIDRSSYTVTKSGEKIILPKKEFELLYFLSLHPDVVYGRDDLLKYIWGSDVYVVARTIDVHIRKVREKIGEGYITTIKGIGYKFSKEDQ